MPSFKLLELDAEAPQIRIHLLILIVACVVLFRYSFAFGTTRFTSLAPFSCDDWFGATLQALLWLGTFDQLVTVLSAVASERAPGSALVHR